MSRSLQDITLFDFVLLLIIGESVQDRMDRERIDAEDILESARSSHGISRFDQIRHAVLERNGSISIVPNTVGKAPGGRLPSPSTGKLLMKSGQKWAMKCADDNAL